MNACKLTSDEALQLLDNHHWDESEAIRYYTKHQDKLNKQNKKKQATKGNNDDLDNDDNDDNEMIVEGGKTAGGATELQPVKTRRHKNDKKESLVNQNDDDEQQNDRNQGGAFVNAFCCG